MVNPDKQLKGIATVVEQQTQKVRKEFKSKLQETR
jgi:hypothetical protein